MNSEVLKDRFDLSRFIDAQSNVYDLVLQELSQGQKRSHWMWYIFPQIDGLGATSTSMYYSIKSLDEAVEYLHHPVLGKRLVECTGLVLEINNHNAEQIFGFPDYLKFYSSMTLFSIAANNFQIFLKALEKYNRGELDTKTLALL